MKIRSAVFLLCLSLLLPFAIAAQSPVHCGTDLIDAQFQTQYPASRRINSDLERGYQEYMRQSNGNSVRNTYTIPVVVHVIQYSAQEDISDARIRSQIDVLNEDFSLLNADTSSIPPEFRPFASDTQIEFCLASVDASGCPTDGIVRVIAPNLADHAIGQSGQMKALSQWDPARYLNIWVPVSIADNILGYATFPGTLQFNPAEDGVVINGYYMGRGNGIGPGAFDLGRTGTHEVGHWLGLYHTFQGSCSGTNDTTCISEGDRVCDTPPTANPNYGCPTSRNSCTETPIDRNDMMVNYMDYGDDACLLMFSSGQSDRMYYFLQNVRSNIWSPTNLSNTGCDGTPAIGCYPLADYTANSFSVCAGDSIQFSDLSTGPAATWSWGFQGGSPSSSSLENPVVSFAQPGTYTVSLAVTNAYGVDVVSKSVEVVTPELPPLVEGFEAATLPGGWYLRDEDQAGTWEITSLAASEGQNSMVTRNYIHRQKGTRDELVSTLYDLSYATAASLVFDRAYKRRDAFSPDTLRVLVSTDCGRNWEELWKRGGIQLATTPGLAIPAEFVPNASQWQADTIDLSNYLGFSGLRIMFQCIGRYGQSLYLDRINLEATLTNLPEEITKPMDLRVFPNPFREQPEIEVQLNKAQDIEWYVSDLQGRVLLHEDRKLIAPGRHLLHFKAGFWGNLPAGVYIMTVNNVNGNLSRKLIKM